MLTHLYTVEIQLRSHFGYYRASWWRPTLQKAVDEIKSICEREEVSHGSCELSFRVVKEAIENVPEEHAKIWRNWKPA